jgi:2-amino-4-hydroxy-6-hydroxymethyldihydropteridine diphosphokinase
VSAPEERIRDAQGRIRDARETLAAVRRADPRNDPGPEDLAALHELHAAHERKHGRDERAEAAERRARRARPKSAYVGLGANLGDRRRTIERAVELLSECRGIRVVRRSSLRETAPVGYTEQPAFLNGVALLATTRSPLDLLDCLLAVEEALGRTRTGPRFGPRTIDLDLLVYGDVTVQTPRLELPHPRLAEREFVLAPLVELDPELDVPGLGKAKALLERLPG